ncbi:hypothetical protein JCM10207_007734 [Rhodosporidiobolus poonsookiae]
MARTIKSTRRGGLGTLAKQPPVETVDEPLASSPPATTSAPPAPAPRRRMPSALPILLLSLFFHVCYFPSIFDTYFRSPVVAVSSRHKVDDPAPAQRVVLIVGDGLRADKLFQTYPNPPFPASEPLPAPFSEDPHALVDEDDLYTTTPAPFLRGLIQNGQAQWGVSHTRVPTESRPGHVALIGGMYEDVSAVTRGWTTNPVPFDSVFNQSSHTYSFGSPDILPMFKLGASDPSRVSTWSYDEDAEDFTADAVHLDLWVLDQLRTLFRNASSDAALDKQLRQPGVVFFEHLLGLDTTGHSYRPHGSEYHRNIRIVDYIARETAALFKQFYGDDETAFVFTSDHGMSNVGNHGDGHPDNTRTPLVVWGKGVKRSPDWEEPSEHDAYSLPWGLKGVRRDVEQADVAPLMSVLAGLAIPANSAGRVPLDYLDVSPDFRAKAAFANAKQLLAEAEAKSDAKESVASGFQPFPELIDDFEKKTLGPDSHRQVIQNAIDQSKFDHAERGSYHLMDVALRTSRYFQKYDWLRLRITVTSGYLGFMAFVTHHILSSRFPSTGPRSGHADLLAKLQILIWVLFISQFLRLGSEKAPWTYFGYTLFSGVLWNLVVENTDPFLALIKDAPNAPPRTWRDRLAAAPPKLGSAALVLAALFGIGFGYTDRRAFAVIALGMGWAWPTLMLDAEWKEQNQGLRWGWTAAMSVLSVFPLLPVEKGEDLRVVAAGAAALVILAGVALRQLENRASPTWARTRLFILAEVALIVNCLGVTWSSARSLQLKQGLPMLNQYAGWTILGVSALLPLIHGRPRAQPYLERLAVLLLSFAPAFILLSLSYEALFYAVFCVALVAWSSVEASLARQDEIKAKADGQEGLEEGQLGTKHIRVALFFLAFLHLGFFGVGNVASISSFYLEPVYRLMTVFAPFPMGALLLYKLLLPFFALSAISSTLNRHLRLPPLALSLIGTVLSDILTVAFFFRVTDEGSWLEIGSSITNFVICSLLGIFSSALLGAGEGMMGRTVG